MEDEYVNTTQAKEILQVSYKTIFRWAKDGKIRFITTPSGRKRYNTKDIFNITDRTLFDSKKDKIC